MFKAALLEKSSDQVTLRIADMEESDLSPGDVHINVDYSSINYKDALAITNRGPIVRRWPMIPGIDGAGTVKASESAEFKVGDRVILNGWGVGEAHLGCLAQRANVRSDWLIRMPGPLDSWSAMAIGTAGYTAMLCVQAIERHRVAPAHGEVLVTGASGGVGSFAITLLSALGYDVVASTGRAAEHDYLRQLGAGQVIDRALLSGPGKPLAKERWAAVVDTVGSHTLVNACASTRYSGIVAACGMAQGMDFPGSVAPFILRGVSLVGIDSVMASRADRISAWQRLAMELTAERLRAIAHEVPLNDVVTASQNLIGGKARGRTVVNVNA